MSSFTPVYTLVIDEFGTPMLIRQRGFSIVSVTQIATALCSASAISSTTTEKSKGIKEEAYENNYFRTILQQVPRNHSPSQFHNGTNLSLDWYLFVGEDLGLLTPDQIRRLKKDAKNKSEPKVKIVGGTYKGKKGRLNCSDALDFDRLKTVSVILPDGEKTIKENLVFI